MYQLNRRYACGGQGKPQACCIFEMGVAGLCEIKGSRYIAFSVSTQPCIALELPLHVSCSPSCCCRQLSILNPLLLVLLPPPLSLEPCCRFWEQAVQSAVSKLPADASLGQVERNVMDACVRAARWFNNRKPEVIVVAYDHDPRAGSLVDAAARRREQQQQRGLQPQPPQSPTRRPSTAAAAAASPVRQKPQQQQLSAAAVAASGAVRSSSISSSSSSDSSTSTGRTAAKSSTPAAPGSTKRGPLRRLRRTAAPAPPPVQVLPSDVQLPVYQNPRQNPNAAEDDSDLSFG